ncbi:par-6 family cell polarity regulator gamma a [Trichomycterus rosablanca]|uniref:par-6 family cell polarity regulator gamma a n=1 Tax=Trichomycterus rosablanca TaxID=2290929 RepID=UPI002F3612AC
MIRNLGKTATWHCCPVVEVKSKFGAEFRRFSLDRYEPGKCKDFRQFILSLHQLYYTEVFISYADLHGDLLPINNDENFCKAVSTAQPLLRIFIQLQEEVDQISNNYVTRRNKSTVAVCTNVSKERPIQISVPQNFRPVSSIIDADILPVCHRRVRLYRQASDKPLGFYIRDGTTVSVTPHGLVKVPGIFISQIVPGGLADSCGLLAINDQVLEVNGIELTGKSLDQVTDMMIANSCNLIITVKPANQCNNIRNPVISSIPELLLDGGNSVSYPGLPIIMKSYFGKGNSYIKDKNSGMVVEKAVNPSSCSTVALQSSHIQYPHLAYTRESWHSQPCLNNTAHSGSSTSLLREMGSQQHYKSNPSFRQNAFSTHDLLGTLSLDLRQRLMVPVGAMEEDGIVFTL